MATTALLIAPQAWGKTRILRQVMEKAPPGLLRDVRLLEKLPDREDQYRGGCIVRLAGPRAQELFSEIQKAAHTLGLAWDQLHVSRSAITTRALEAAYQWHPVQRSERPLFKAADA